MPKKTPPFPNTQAAIALLGTVPDAEAARRLKIPEAAVAEQRRHRGIPATPSGNAMPAEALAQLGKRSDRAIAEDFGFALHQVTTARLRRGIAGARKTHRWGKLPRAIVALLGKQSDASLAKRAKVPVATLTYRRNRLGIPACPTRLTPTASARRLLGKVTDAEVGRRFDVSAATARSWRLELGIPSKPQSREFPPAMIRSLGKQSDCALSRRYGFATSTIRDKRAALGIAPAPKPAALPKAAMALLGKLSDEAIGERFHASPGTVANVRRRLRIGVAATSANPGIKQLPSYDRSVKSRWLPNGIPEAMWQRMGQEPDNHLADELGVPFHVIRHLRRRANIPAPIGPPRSRHQPTAAAAQ